jgi:ABC-type lipoprotein export system ATPase subunit
MSDTTELLRTPIRELQREYPFLERFFTDNHLDTTGHTHLPLGQLLDAIEERGGEGGENGGVEPALIRQQLGGYVEQMLAFLGSADETVQSLAVLPGVDKDGRPETFGELVLRAGEVVCIVGPTGSGKSRLLADIEWVAQCDTPTRRQILLNGEVPARKWRFSPTHKLVAQLSQNMNFVMDLSVEEFLHLHAESRMVEHAAEVVGRIHAAANELAGEGFASSTPVTSLSGGQSRALMIADTAILSRSPIVLIDEIENAGIDRRKALDLLLTEDKIVLMATHDPVLALLGSRRLVIQNGGIAAVISTTDAEQALLGELSAMDRRLQELRHRLRAGERLQ